MEWTKNQKAAQVLRDYFGEPPAKGTGAFETWSWTLADFIEQNPPPAPEVGERYGLADGDDLLTVTSFGTCVGLVPGAVDEWVFEVSDRGVGKEYFAFGIESIVAKASELEAAVARTEYRSDNVQEIPEWVMTDEAAVTADVELPPHPPIEYRKTVELDPEELNPAHDSPGDVVPEAIS